MSLFILNIVFAGVFTILLGSDSIGIFLSGFILGYIALWFSKPLYHNSRYFEKLLQTLGLVGYFLKALLISNLRVLWEVIRPRQINRPGIIGIPLTAKTDLEIFIVANLISLTPGTLSVDISSDRKTLFVHIMFLDNLEAARMEIKNGLERRVLEVMRR